MCHICITSLSIESFNSWNIVEKNGLWIHLFIPLYMTFLYVPLKRIEWKMIFAISFSHMIYTKCLTNYVAASGVKDASIVPDQRTTDLPWSLSAYLAQSKMWGWTEVRMQYPHGHKRRRESLGNRCLMIIKRKRLNPNQQGAGGSLSPPRSSAIHWWFSVFEEDILELLSSFEAYMERTEFPKPLKKLRDLSVTDIS